MSVQSSELSSPTPSTASECVSFPRGSGAREPYLLAGEGVHGEGDPIQTNGQKLSYSLRDSWSDSSSRNLGSNVCGPDLQMARFIKMKTDQTN